MLGSLSQTALDEYTTSVAALLDEKPKTLMQEAAMVWPEIVDAGHRWTHEAELAASVRELGLDELTSFFDAHFDARAPLRRKLASSWWSQADQQASQLESQREDAGAEHAQTDP